MGQPRSWVVGLGAILAVLGALLVTYMGLVAPFASDVCSPDSAAIGCSARGQGIGLFAGLAGGPLSLAAGPLVAFLVHRRRWWPWLALAFQWAALGVMSMTAFNVS